MASLGHDELWQILSCGFSVTHYGIATPFKLALHVTSVSELSEHWGPSQGGRMLKCPLILLYLPLPVFVMDEFWGLFHQCSRNICQNAWEIMFRCNLITITISPLQISDSNRQHVHWQDCGDQKHYITFKTWMFLRIVTFKSKEFCSWNEHPDLPCPWEQRNVNPTNKYD